MATVLVRSDADQAILMSEQVVPAHLDDEHSAYQFLERLAWAIEDAEASRRNKKADLRRRTDAARREAAKLPS